MLKLKMGFVHFVTHAPDIVTEDKFALIEIYERARQFFNTVDKTNL